MAVINLKDVQSKAYARLQHAVGQETGQASNPRNNISVRTRIYSLDFALGGGIPAGLNEIYGEESVGKTALIARILHAAQAQNKDTMLVPSEQCELEYLRALGVDLDSLLLTRGRDPRITLMAASDFVSDGPNRVLVIDSLTGLIGSLEAREWNNVVFDFIQRTADYMETTSSVIVVSQVRTRRSVQTNEAIQGVVSASRRFADLFTVRLAFSREEVSDETFEMVINVEANLYAPPATIVRLPVIKGQGIQTDVDAIRVALSCGHLYRVGSWYRTQRGEQFGPGIKTAAQQFEESGAYKELEKLIYG